jgi:hypothetical protein
LFRQREFGEWSGAIDDLRHELKRIGAQCAKHRPNGEGDSADASLRYMLRKLSA